MNAEETFGCWAPDSSLWSRWAKPVGFLGCEAVESLRAPGEPDPPPVDVSGVPYAEDNAALVVNLPGPIAVATGAALAARGYQPIPLFNGVHSLSAVLDTESLQKALLRFARPVADLPLSPDAPPAFLLDSSRLAKDVAVRPDDFDNRWIVMPQDFPSAAFLRSQGIRRVVVLEREQASFDEDLRHVLRRWQEGGLPIARLDPASPSPVPQDVPRPSRFRSLFYRLFATGPFRRNAAGGFGSSVPVPSEGGGGGWGYG